jgi:hypothetical protein
MLLQVHVLLLLLVLALLLEPLLLVLLRLLALLLGPLLLALLLLLAPLLDGAGGLLTFSAIKLHVFSC